MHTQHPQAPRAETRESPISTTLLAVLYLGLLFEFPHGCWAGSGWMAHQGSWGLMSVLVLGDVGIKCFLGAAQPLLLVVAEIP